MKILLIEDEIALLETIVSYLERCGFVCEKAPTYEDAIEKIFLYEYDLFIVDINLPDGNGLKIIEELKKLDVKSGVIIVSAKNALKDKITGLEIGADDYLTKPFSLAELNARIRSVLRRRNFDGSNIIELDPLKIDLNSREVTVCGERLFLTKKEYDLLLYFVSNREKVVTKESIAEHLLGDQADLLDSFDFIYTHVKNLRKKILGTGGPDYIKTIYSTGYKFSLQ